MQKHKPSTEKFKRFSCKKASHEILVTLTLGVNFINVLQTAFAPADSESAKKTDNLTVVFVLLRSALEKPALKNLMKLAPGRSNTRSSQ
jgi:hypothetical protein